MRGFPGSRTAEYARSVLSRAINRALKWNLIGRNPVNGTDAPRVARREPTPLTQEQAHALLEAVTGHRLEILYRLLLGLGLRRGEVVGLRWSDIDFEARTLKVTGIIQRVDGTLVRSAPKTAKSARTLPLPAAIVEALHR